MVLPGVDLALQVDLIIQGSWRAGTHARNRTQGSHLWAGLGKGTCLRRTRLLRRVLMQRGCQWHSKSTLHAGTLGWTSAVQNLRVRDASFPDVVKWKHWDSRVSEVTGGTEPSQDSAAVPPVPCWWTPAKESQKTQWGIMWATLHSVRLAGPTRKPETLLYQQLSFYRNSALPSPTSPSLTDSQWWQGSGGDGVEFPILLKELKFWKWGRYPPRALSMCRVEIKHSQAQ